MQHDFPTPNDSLIVICFSLRKVTQDRYSTGKQALLKVNTRLYTQTTAQLLPNPARYTAPRLATQAPSVFY